MEASAALTRGSGLGAGGEEMGKGCGEGGRMRCESTTERANAGQVGAPGEAKDAESDVRCGQTKDGQDARI
jgi:hypothetical protein